MHKSLHVQYDYSEPCSDSLVSKDSLNYCLLHLLAGPNFSFFSHCSKKCVDSEFSLILFRDTVLDADGISMEYWHLRKCE